MQYTKQDLEDFNHIVTETAKKILNDPKAKALADKFGTCSVYFENNGIGVQVSITKPKK